MHCISKDDEESLNFMIYIFSLLYKLTVNVYCKPHCNVFTCNSLSLTFIVSSLSRIMLFSCSIILPWASHCMARSLSAIMSLLPFGYRQTYILMHIVNNGYFFSFVEIRQKLLQFRIQFNHKDYKSINFYKLN